MTSVSQSLLAPAAEWLNGLTTADIPGSGNAATRAYVDWLGCVIAGAGDPAAPAVRRAIEGPAPAGMFASSSAVAPSLAALVNGALAHASEADDIYSPGLVHLGAPTVAAAMAVAELSGVSGDRLLSGITSGYEVGGRISSRIQPQHYEVWNTTGTVGCIAAAAAVSHVLDCTVEQSLHAMNTAAAMAAGTREAYAGSSDGKLLASGHAALVGVTAGLLAAEGVRGALTTVDGPRGLGRAMANGVSWEGLFDGVGEAPVINNVTFKPYPCCGHAFAAIDAAIELSRQLQSSGTATIADVRVDTYQIALEVAGRESLESPRDAKFSLPYLVAAALLHGEVAPTTFTRERLADRTLRSLASKVSLQASPLHTGAYPTRRGATVSVRFTDGQELAVEQPQRKGEPETSLSDSELSDKFLSAATSYVPEVAGQLLEQAWAIGTAGDVASVARNLNCIADGGQSARGS